MDTDILLTTAEAAFLTGLSRSAFSLYAKQGKIKVQRAGRFLRIPVSELKKIGFDLDGTIRRLKDMS